jgi:hypothetical protein
VQFAVPATDRCPVPRPQTTWRAPGSGPLADADAAACVVPSGENRPQNVKMNAKAPTAAELHAFRTARDAHGRTPAAYYPGFAFVTGAAAQYGLRSTDDLIEWAAYKWGIPEDFVRAQMYVESRWSMLQKGDRRDWPMPVSDLYPAPAVIDADSVWESLGIAQLRWRHTIPWNPGIEPLRWQSTGFALDYSQALIRYYYDGHCDWCGDGYRPGDADGAYRAYVSGSWTQGQWYADEVRRDAASKPWQPIPRPRAAPAARGPHRRLSLDAFDARAVHPEHVPEDLLQWRGVALPTQQLDHADDAPGADELERAELARGEFVGHGEAGYQSDADLRPDSALDRLDRCQLDQLPGAAPEPVERLVDDAPAAGLDARDEQRQLLDVGP